MKKTMLMIIMITIRQRDRQRETNLTNAQQLIASQLSTYYRHLPRKVVLWGEDDLWQICRTYGKSTAHVRMRFIEEITMEMFTPLCQNSKFPDGLIIIILCPHADYIVSSKCHLGPCPIQMTSLDDDPIWGQKRRNEVKFMETYIGNDGGRVPLNANIYVIGSRC